MKEPIGQAIYRYFHHNMKKLDEKKQKAFLDKKDHSKEDLRETDLSMLNLQENDFSKCDIGKASFFMSNLAGCSFKSSDLTGVDFKFANLSGVEWEGSKRNGFQITGFASIVINGNFHYAFKGQNSKGMAYLVNEDKIPEYEWSQSRGKMFGNMLVNILNNG